MTIKPLAIQGADLTLGGVNLQAGTTGVVIPGITRAANYIPEQVEDTGDQTVTWGRYAPIVIDYTRFSILNGDYTPAGNYEPATYFVDALDDEGYIDGGIDITDPGANWDSVAANGAQNNDMKAATQFRVILDLNESGQTGTILGGGTYSFPVWLHSFNMVGWKVYIGGVDTGKTIVTQDNTYSGGNTTGLVFSDNINATTDDWQFSPAGYPFGGIDYPWNAGDWEPIPFRVKIRAGEVESDIITNRVQFDNAGGIAQQADATPGRYNIQLNAEKDIVFNTDEASNEFRFTSSGKIQFPNGSVQTGGFDPVLTKVDGQALVTGVLKFGEVTGGSISDFDSMGYTAVYFNSATGGHHGKKYAVGGDYGEGLAFLNKYNKDGTLEWSFSFDKIDFGFGYQTVYPYTIKRVPDGSNYEFIYVGFDVSSYCGAVKFNQDGVVQQTWIYQVDDPEFSSIDHHALEIDGDGNPILVGRQNGAWDSYSNVATRTGTGVNTLVVNTSDIGNAVGVYNNTGDWRIDISGNGTNKINPDTVNRFGPLPVTALQGSGGVHSLVEGEKYTAGGLQLDFTTATAKMVITAASWTNANERNLILAHNAMGSGWTYEFVCAPGSRYSFTLTSEWTETDPGVSGIWTAEGSLAVVSGANISTVVNVTSLAYGANKTVYVYYYINGDGRSQYDHVEVHDYGTGYNDSDAVKIPGSLLLGTDGGWLLSCDLVSNNGTTAYISKTLFPDLDQQLSAGNIARFNSNGTLGTVTGVTDALDGNWAVAVTMTSGTIGTSTSVKFFAGNDLLGNVQNGGWDIAFTSDDSFPVQGKVVFNTTSNTDFRGVENTNTYASGTDYTAGLVTFGGTNGINAPWYVVVDNTLTAINALMNIGTSLTVTLSTQDVSTTILDKTVGVGETTYTVGDLSAFGTSGTSIDSIGVGNGTWPTNTTWDIERSLGNQGFVITNGWQKTYGGSNNQEFISASFDTANNILYAAGDFNISNSGDTLIMAIDMGNGNILWQKSISDPDGAWNSFNGLVADGDNDCVYVPYQTDEGSNVVLKISSTGTLIWASRDTGSNGWNGQPQVVVDSNSDPILVGVMNMYQWDPDTSRNELAFVKLSKTDGSLVYANAITRINNFVDINEYMDSDAKPVSIVDDVIYWGGWIFDYNDYNPTGLTVAVPADGTALGLYGDWLYHEIHPNDYQPGDNNINFDFSTWTTSVTLVTQSYTASSDFAMTYTSNYSVDGTTQWPYYDGRSQQIGGIAQVEFNDGSFFDQPGIGRAGVDTGDNGTWLTADMNGKFRYFANNPDGWNSTLYIPSNSNTPLPIGYTLTLVIGDFNGARVYVNNDGNSDVQILVAGSDNFSNNYWQLNANTGNANIYTIMKVDTDTWMLAGPDITIDLSLIHISEPTRPY